MEGGGGRSSSKRPRRRTQSDGSGGGGKRPGRAGSPSSTPARAAVSRGWAMVPKDILMMVVSRLPTFVDLQRFRCVCRPWCTVAASLDDPQCHHGAPLCPPLPYLLLPGPAGADDLSRRLYSVTDGKIHRLDFPEESRSWWCYGSSGGWLAMVDLLGRIFLFNPVSGTRINLPDLSTMPQVKAVFQSPKGAPMWIYKDCFGKNKFPMDWVQSQYVQKVVWCGRPGERDCIVMMIYAGDFKLAYTRIGDERWRRVNTGDWDGFGDIMYHDASKQFYAVTFWGSTISIEFSDVLDERGEQQIPRSQRPRMKVFADPPYKDKDEMVGKYLIGLPSGEILLVLRHYAFEDEGDVPYKTEGFQVFEPVPRVQEKGWMEVKSLGDCAIFLGYNSAIWLSSSQVLHSCRPNSIYFTDDLRERFRSDMQCGWTDEDECRGCDVGVFNLEARTTECLYPLESPVVMPTPVWITPSRDFVMPTTIL